MKIKLDEDQGGLAFVCMLLFTCCVTLCILDYNVESVRAQRDVQIHRAMTGGTDGQQETVTQTRKVERL